MCIRDRYEDVLTRIMKKQQEVDIELKPTCAPQFLRIADQLGYKTRFHRGCLAGLSYCIISPRGKVQPCAYLNMELGDVRETPFDELWAKNEVLQKLRTLDYSGGCGACQYKGACGGCRARAAYYHGGDYMSEEPWCLDVYKRQGNAYADVIGLIVCASVFTTGMTAIGLTGALTDLMAVSYTHLDVYKRQPISSCFSTRLSVQRRCRPCTTCSASSSS